MDDHSGRRPRRKPLCDLTNAPSLSSAAATSITPDATYKSKLRPRYSAVINSSVFSNPACISPSCSSTAGSAAPANPKPGIVRVSSQIGLQIRSSSVCNAGNYERDVHSTLNMVQRKDKEMDVGKDVSAIAAFSCPPLEKIRAAGRMKQVGDSLPGSYSVPCQKKKKRKRHTKPQHKFAEHKLPQGFIDENRAYFQELDAFVLHEELISESELE